MITICSTKHHLKQLVTIKYKTNVKLNTCSNSSNKFKSQSNNNSTVMPQFTGINFLKIRLAFLSYNSKQQCDNSIQITTRSKKQWLMFPRCGPLAKLFIRQNNHNFRCKQCVTVTYHKRQEWAIPQLLRMGLFQDTLRVAMSGFSALWEKMSWQTRDKTRICLHGNINVICNSKQVNPQNTLLEEAPKVTVVSNLKMSCNDVCLYLVY